MFEELEEYSDLEYLDIILPMFVDINIGYVKPTYTQYIGKISYRTTEDDWNEVYIRIKRQFGDRLLEFYTVEAGRCFEVYLRQHIT